MQGRLCEALISLGVHVGVVRFLDSTFIRSAVSHGFKKTEEINPGCRHEMTSHEWVSVDRRDRLQQCDHLSTHHMNTCIRSRYRMHWLEWKTSRSSQRCSKILPISLGVTRHYTGFYPAYPARYAPRKIYPFKNSLRSALEKYSRDPVDAGLTAAVSLTSAIDHLPIGTQSRSLERFGLPCYDRRKNLIRVR